MPFSPLYFLLFVFLLGVLMALVQVGLVTLTFQKLGLSSHGAFTLLFSSLLGSMFNVPLFTIRSNVPPARIEPRHSGLLLRSRLVVPGKTVIAVNLGGCLIPLAFSLYLYTHTSLGFSQTVLATAIVVAASYWFSRPISGIGIGMPALVAPLIAALTAMGLGGENSAPLAYICGSLGVVIGADLMRIKDVRRFGVPMASIGGAGTFDGIFLTGLLAVLLT
jgi:uncharacterized membrane protein